MLLFIVNCIVLPWPVSIVIVIVNCLCSYLVPLLLLITYLWQVLLLPFYHYLPCCCYLLLLLGDGDLPAPACLTLIITIYYRTYAPFVGCAPLFALPAGFFTPYYLITIVIPIPAPLPALLTTLPVGTLLPHWQRLRCPHYVTVVVVITLPLPLYLVIVTLFIVLLCSLRCCVRGYAFALTLELIVDCCFCLVTFPTAFTDTPVTYRLITPCARAVVRPCSALVTARVYVACIADVVVGLRMLCVWLFLLRVWLVAFAVTLRSHHTARATVTTVHTLRSPPHLPPTTTHGLPLPPPPRLPLPLRFTPLRSLPFARFVL